MQSKQGLSKKQIKKLKQQQKRHQQQRLNQQLTIKQLTQSNKLSNKSSKLQQQQHKLQQKQHQSQQLHKSPQQLPPNKQSKEQKHHIQSKQQSKPQHKIKQPAQSQSNQQQLQLDQNGDIDFNQLVQQNQINHQTINVTFLIAEIRSEYYHSMKTVLLRYSQLTNITQSQLANQILEKGNTGNVIVAQDDQQEGEDQSQSEQSQVNQKQQENDQLNVYSVVTLLPSSNKVTEKIKKQANTSADKHKTTLKNYNKLHQILTTPKSCTLLLSARLPNLPSFIVCNSHQVFVSDLIQLRKKNSKHPIFQSEYILNVSEVQITNSQTKVLDELIFSKYEDFQFCQKSICWWVGQNVKSQRQKADLRKLYFVMKLKDYFEATKNIKNYLDDEA